jgi:hypothetical protein
LRPQRPGLGRKIAGEGFEALRTIAGPIKLRNNIITGA